MSKKCLVQGGNGFIGHHLARRLKREGNKVIVVDVKKYEYGTIDFCDENLILDLTKEESHKYLYANGTFDEVYNLAAWMGGAGVIFTGENDARVMHDSALINLFTAEYAYRNNVAATFFSSSACAYPKYNQKDPRNPICTEDSAYPADPDSDYGFEKLFSERLYAAYRRNFGLNTKVARFHNIFGIESTWQGGREKAPAAVCRKIASANDGDTVEFWGTGDQTRSFLYVTECVEGILRLTRSDFTGPVNIGSDEMVTIRDLVNMVLEFSGKNLNIKWTGGGPVGVAGRNSDNRLIKEKLGWAPNYPLKNGMKLMYDWVDEQVRASR